MARLSERVKICTPFIGGVQFPLNHCRQAQDTAHMTFDIIQTAWAAAIAGENLIPLDNGKVMLNTDIILEQ